MNNKKNSNQMKTSSKIIISTLLLFVLVLAGGWSYTEGYLTGMFTGGNNDLEAKKSNYPNYLNRFEFDGITFVDNVALAVPTPETVKTYANLDGVLTLKHNESKSKVLYVDTPNRVSLSSDDKTFYYTSEQLTDVNNDTFTRHKFYLLPNVEYNFNYKILNVNEFVDHDGEISFTLRDKDLTISKEVTTEFMSPLDDYPTLSGDIFFKNVKGTGIETTFTGDPITFNDVPINTTGNSYSSYSILSVDQSFRLSFNSNTAYFFIYIKYSDRGTYGNPFISYPLGGSTLFNITITNNSVTLEGNLGNIISMPFQLDYNKPKGKTLRFGDTKTTQIKEYYSTYTSLFGVYMHQSYSSYFCKSLGFDTASLVNAPNIATTYYFTTGVWTGISSSNGIADLVCRNNNYQNEGGYVIFNINSSKMMPYMLDTTRTIKTDFDITEVKINLGDTLQTLVLTKENGISSFTIPSEIVLDELEPSRVKIKIDSKEYDFKYFYDPSRSQKDLWVMFDAKLVEMEG